MSWAGYDVNAGGIADGEGLEWSDSEQAFVPVVLGAGSDVSVEDDGTEVTSAATVLDFGTGLTVTDNGSGDVTIDATGGGGSGGGGLTEIEQVVVGGGGQTTITFASIAADFEDLLIVLSGRGTTSAQGVQVLANFNNDTGSTYDWQRGVHFNGASSTGSESIAASSARFGFINAASATADVPGFLRVLIPAYARTTFDKSAIYECGYWNTNDPELAVEHGTAWWDDTSAITEIDLTCSAGDFAEGTVATLYGIGGADLSRKQAGIWFQDNVAASQSAVVLNLEGGNRTETVAVRAGSVTGIAVRSNEARTAGTLTVDVTVNGTVTGLTAVLDGTDTTAAASTQAADLDTYVAADAVGVKITTDGSWAPATADVTVAVEISE